MGVGLNKFTLLPTPFGIMLYLLTTLLLFLFLLLFTYLYEMGDEWIRSRFKSCIKEKVKVTVGQQHLFLPFHVFSSYLIL